MNLIINSLRNIVRILVTTFIVSILRYNVGEFYKIWYQAIKMAKVDSRDVIEDKELLSFINDKRWYKKFSIGLPLPLTQKVRNFWLRKRKTER